MAMAMVTMTTTRKIHEPQGHPSPQWHSAAKSKRKLGKFQPSAESPSRTLEMHPVTRLLSKTEFGRCYHRLKLLLIELQVDPQWHPTTSANAPLLQTSRYSASEDSQSFPRCSKLSEKQKLGIYQKNKLELEDFFPGSESSSRKKRRSPRPYKVPSLPFALGI